MCVTLYEYCRSDLPLGVMIHECTYGNCYCPETEATFTRNGGEGSLQPPEEQPPVAPPSGEIVAPVGQIETAPSEQALAPQDIEIPPSVMNSPILSPTSIGSMPPMTPPPNDMDIGPSGRPSILKALSGLWPQQAPRSRAEPDLDDPMADPEHIFRESSMVVRTDEPTSIIALALK